MCQMLLQVLRTSLNTFKLRFHSTYCGFTVNYPWTQWHKTMYYVHGLSRSGILTEYSRDSSSLPYSIWGPAGRQLEGWGLEPFDGLLPHISGGCYSLSTVCLHSYTGLSMWPALLTMWWLGSGGECPERDWAKWKFYCFFYHLALEVT